MIWITTLCLLAVALWLFFNALNERRWVEDHSHDETVASDEGLLASLTGSTKTAGTSFGSGNESVIDRTAAKLKTSSDKLGEQVSGAKKSAEEMYERAKQSDGALGENSTVGRLAAKTKEKASDLNKKLDSGMKSASSLATGRPDADGNNESFLKKAAATSGSVTQKVAQSVKSSADNLSGKTNAAGDESFLSKVAGKVSDGMSAVDQKLDNVAAKRSTGPSSDS